MTITPAALPDSSTGLRRSAGRRIGASSPAGALALIAQYVALTAVALAFVVPLLWLFLSSLKTSADIYRWPISWFPRPLTWENFVRAWTSVPFPTYALNSLILTGVGALGKVLLAITTAYAFVFLRFPLKNVLFVVLLTAIMVPGNVTIIVNYITVSNLGWVNTYLGLIVPGMGSVFGLFLMRQHFLTIPRDLVEAAQVDGAGHVRTLFTILTPVSRPIVATVAVIAVIDEWNSFVWPLIVTNTDSMRTLTIGLYFLAQSDNNIPNWGVILAGTIIVLLPMLVIFFAAQRYIVSGLTQGAIKG